MSAPDGIMEPPAAGGLFQITLASNDLHAYLRRLATEIDRQNRLSVKMAEDILAVRAELESLSRNTLRISEEQNVKISSLQNAMAVTVNQSQLRASTSNVQRQIDAIAKMLETDLNDDDGSSARTPLSADGPCVATCTQVITEKGQVFAGAGQISPLAVVGDNSVLTLDAPAQGRSDAGHKADSEACIADRAVDIISAPVQTPTNVQQSPRTRASNVTPAPSGGAIPSAITANSSVAGGGIRVVVDKCIQEWYKSRGLIDAKIRHEITSSGLRGLIADLGAELRQEVKAMASELVGITFFHESQETMRGGIVRQMEAISSEVERNRAEQSAFEVRMKSLMSSNVRRVVRGARQTNSRIARFYTMMSLPEPVDDVSEDTDSDESESSALAECPAEVSSVSETANPASQPSARTVCSKSDAPNRSRVRKKSSLARRAGDSDVREEAEGSDDGTDAKTNSVIQSPVFVAFRQHVLNDISERIAAARSTQSSDIDIELLAMRNDIRHRVTSTRVVELIKQYTDTDTPARVTALARQVSDLSDEKVSIPDLNDGLRSKADLHTLDSKANVEYVDKALLDLRDRQGALQSDLGLLIADRREYREVVQQLLIQQQRLQAAVSAIGGAKGGSGIAAAPLALGDAAGGRHRHINVESIDAAADGFGHSPIPRGATKTVADASAFAPRPLTELISPRVSGGSMPGSVFHSPCPPLPMLHKPQPPSAVVGLTSNQSAYAKLIAEAGEVGSQSLTTPSKGARTSQLSSTRVNTESKSPLAYTSAQRREHVSQSASPRK